MGLNDNADNSEDLQIKKRKRVKTKKVPRETEEPSVPEATENNEDVATNVDVNESVDDCSEPKIKKKKKEKKKKEEDTTPAKNENDEGNDESKTEPKKKEKSIRQIKKEKHEERLNLARETSKQESAKKALNYVSKWKHAKSHWKFEKLKQIWLMENFLSDKYVPDTMFPTILEYFEGIKGLARQKLTDKATAIIKKTEENSENDEEREETTEYTRAKKLIELFSCKE